MGKALMLVVVLLVIMLLLFGQYVGTRNTLVQKNEAVKSAWSQVDVVLQRRADLIQEGGSRAAPSRSGRVAF